MPARQPVAAAVRISDCAIDHTLRGVLDLLRRNVYGFSEHGVSPWGTPQATGVPRPPIAAKGFGLRSPMNRGRETHPALGKIAARANYFPGAADDNPRPRGGGITWRGLKRTAIDAWNRRRTMASPLPIAPASCATTSIRFRPNPPRSSPSCAESLSAVGTPSPVKSI
jgi:hypothetical protein